MNKPEQQFWKLISEHLPPRAHKIRVENTIGNGMPDANVCYKGKEIWIELKVIEGTCKIRKEQHVWGLRRSMAGGRVYVINKLYRTIQFFAFPLEVEPINDEEKRIISLPWECDITNLTDEFERLFS